ncbi:MAG: hypothetical protein ACRYGM_01840 [Janthinobacterium lividum]
MARRIAEHIEDHIPDRRSQFGIVLVTNEAARAELLTLQRMARLDGQVPHPMESELELEELGARHALRDEAD